MEDEPPREEDAWQPQQQRGQREEEEEEKDRPCSGEGGGGASSSSSDPRRDPARSEALGGGGAKQADEALLVSSWLTWLLTSLLAHRSSAGKDWGQEEAESRTCSVAETAVCRMKPGCLESELQALRSSTHPLALQFLQALERPIQIAAQLFAENQRLQQELQSHPRDQVTHLLAENQQLQQELQELKSSRKAQGAPKGTRYVPVPQSRVFPVQVLTTGHTGGCEKQFLNEVAQLLVNERVSLQVEDYTRNVEGFLLLFCPVVSRMGTDIENALEELGRKQKVLLVVLHLKPKDSGPPIIHPRRPVEHPALVTTVHACFSIQDGFYPSPTNKEAVASVAVAITQKLKGDS